MTANEQRLREALQAAQELNEQQAEQLGQQAEQLAQQAEQLAQQTEQMEALVAQVEVLQEALRKSSSNSSKPPSSDSPSQRERNRRRRARLSSGRKRGGQPKHKGSFRQLVTPDEVDRMVPLFPKQCGNCWGELPQVGCASPRRYQTVEVTRGGVEITEYQRHVVTCPDCGFDSWASCAPVPRSPFGPRLCSIVVMLTGVYHLSRRQAQRLLHDIWQLRISLGAISAIERRMSQLLAPVYQQAQKLADDAAVKHTDGTSWRQAGVALQLWTVASASVTVFSIVADGTAKTLRALFGTLKGILISDRAKAINFWAMNRRQVCWAHLLRKFIAFSERDGPAGRFGTELVAYTAVVFDTHRAWQRGLISWRVFRQRMVPVRLQLEALLQRAVDANIARLSGSCADMLAHKQALWTFVDRRGVDPTNNHAERELRAFVLWRKRSFGTRSDRGNRFAERIMTAVHSLRKQRRDVLPTLTALADGSLPARQVLAAA